MGPDTPQSPRPQPRWRTALDIVATLAIIGAAGTMIWSNRSGAAAPPAAARPELPMPTEPVSIEGSPALGDPNAKVVIIAFSDFECPYCGRFAREVLPELKKQYIDTGQVQFVFKHLPLTNIHTRAMPAAIAAECAAQQTKFWEFHDELFRDGSTLDESGIVAHAANATVDLERLEACRTAGGNGRVASDAQGASHLGLRGTPAFLVGFRTTDGLLDVKRIIPGAQPVSEFNGAIGALLREL